MPPKPVRTDLERDAPEPVIPVVGSDRSVILRSLEEPRAFGELFDRHARTIHRFITRRADAVVADDVVSETFLRAFEQRTRFDVEREDALPWLFGIAVNVLRRHRHVDLRFVPEDPERADDRDHVAATGRRIDAERQLRVVLAAVRRMPARTRDVVLLHAWGGLSDDQVAEALRIPVGTVKSRLSRARATLRALPVPTTIPNGDPYGRDAAAPQLP